MDLREMGAGRWGRGLREVVGFEERRGRAWRVTVWSHRLCAMDGGDCGGGGGDGL
jgi:hypothetical protein